MRVIKTTQTVVAAALCFALAVGCGEPPAEEGEPDGENQQQNADPNQQQQNDEANAGEEDCEDDEFFNPAVDECIPVDDNQNNQNNDDNQNNQNNDDPQINDPNNQNNNDNQGDDCGWGAVQGESCRPDGGMLPGATVKLEGDDCHDGGSFEMETTADQDGFYEFDDVPTGHHELTISSGSFVNTDEVPIVDDEITDLTTESAKICVDDEDVDIAVFDGMWDDVPQLLDSMDIDGDFLAGGSTLGTEALDLILDEDALLEYDILFIECQVDEPDDPAEREMAFANLRRFVSEGNSLYVSDRAHPWIYMAYRDQGTQPIPFELEYDPDDDYDGIRSDVQTGSPAGATGTYTAEVVSDEMDTLLGTDTIDLHFDTGNWTIVSSDDLSAAATSHFELDPDQGISWSGTYDGASAVTTYDDPIGDGRIIYTSFHNSEQDQISDIMEEVLEFMIFQL